MSPLLLGAALLLATGSRRGARYRGVTMRKGQTYQLRIKVHRSSIPITQELVDRGREELRKMGVHSITLRVVDGVPMLDVVMTAPQDITYPVGRVRFMFGGYEHEVEYLWAREIDTEPGV